MQIFWVIASIVIFVVLVFQVFQLLNKHIFNRIRINKWILLAISLGLLVFQFVYKPTNYWERYALSAVIVIFFLWFLEIKQFGNPKQEQKVVIKSKAKPNRIKNINKNKKAP
ncbi:hypothetical protein SAMN02745163_01138 [Clostridium cavendishii DSM 21758]|uniref:Uncharacterized protein n=1 Tax=Clostridium cavendishii DSM 21758 TaxID=1121302 RepID=A0A1M6FHP6_9CLOT|nr:hypothetical protein [Clostridium cavendishii]SHI97112.1 hypothetical protein SAMN02745163_01138 [Clostridium cavendishii DSM 21758]